MVWSPNAGVLTGNPRYNYAAVFLEERRKQNRQAWIDYAAAEKRNAALSERYRKQERSTYTSNTKRMTTDFNTRMKVANKALKTQSMQSTLRMRKLNEGNLQSQRASIRAEVGGGRMAGGQRASGTSTFSRSRPVRQAPVFSSKRSGRDYSGSRRRSNQRPS